MQWRCCWATFIVHCLSERCKPLIGIYLHRCVLSTPFLRHFSVHLRWLTWLPTGTRHFTWMFNINFRRKHFCCFRAQAAIAWQMHVAHLIYCYILISVRLWNFKDGGSLKASFLPKNQQAERKFWYQLLASKNQPF